MIEENFCLVPVVETIKVSGLKKYKEGYITGNQIIEHVGAVKYLKADGSIRKKLKHIFYHKYSNQLGAVEVEEVEEDSFITENFKA